MKRTTIYSFLLILSMLMGLQTAWAQSSGSGTQTDPYIIANSTDLNTFGSKMNNNTAYWKLSADIDLGGAEWTYGKNSTATFKGHFDGNGKTIKNFKIVPTSAKNNGFFCTLQGTATSRAEVKNLTIDGVTISQTGDLANTTTTGALAGNVTEYTDIDSVSVKNVSISFKNLTNTNYVGAFIGRVEKNKSTITRCSVVSPTINVTGEIKGGASYIGGAIGLFAGSAKLLSTIDSLVVSSPSVTISKNSVANSYIGGVFGQINKYCTINKVTASKPTLTYSNTDAPNVALYLGTLAGGIIGTADQKVAVTNVKVTDDVKLTIGSSNDVKNVRAGLIGQVNTNVSLDSCTISGDSKITINGNLATTASYLGGFIGYAITGSAGPVGINKVEIGDSIIVNVSGNISAGSYIGGLIGQSTQANSTNNKTTISNIEAKKAVVISVGGNITAGSYLGGLAGYIYSRNAKDCLSTIEHITLLSSSVTVAGQIKASSYIGGLAGYVSNACNKLSDWNVTTDSIALGEITVASYIGGVIGQISGNSGYNAGIDGLTVKKSVVNVNKISVKDCYIGGVFGRINTYCNVIKNVSVSDPSVKYNYADNPNVALNIGSFAGGIFGVAAQKLDITDIKVTGTARLTVGEAAKAATTNISNIKAGLIGNSTNYVSYDNWKVNNSVITFNGKLASSSSYIGGFVGYAAGAANAPLSIQNIVMGSETTKDSITINGNLSVATYIGGLVGYQTISTLKGSSVTGGDITIKGNSTTALYIGGAVGWMNPTVSPYALVQQVEVKKTKIHSSGTHTYAKGNKPLVVGGVVGYMGQSATTFTEVRNCVADSVDIDFSSMIPEAGNTSGSLYNQQQNAFVIGGVIGRINTPSRLPESLFYSGKINAPFAMVAPVVGVFFTKIDAAAYLYDDYVGTNAAYLTTSEWEKTTSWYYNNYKIGLSQALLAETARTKNYLTTDVVTEDGIKYINVKDDTFAKSNVINGIDKSSKTVLAYTQTGKDVDYGIYPSWSTGANTYPAYYMYYMQGVNRGEYVSDAVVQLKKDILEGMGALIDLVFVDENGDITVAANRGVVDHNMKVTPSGEVDSYKWYVDGNVQSETSDAFKYHPSPKGNDITVEAYKDGVCRKRIRYTIKSVLRVTDVSAATYGTKNNPYLIGSAEELQLMSYLSSLPATVIWEKTYKSSDHYNKAYYELDADIDMSDVDDFTPISYPSANSVDGNYGGYHQNVVFDGVFDGQLHTIKNLRETWHSGSFDINDMNVGWGLFSYVGNSSAGKKYGDGSNSPAKICNLIIDGAVLTHKANNTTFAYNGTDAANNCMVGVLAGIVSSNTIVENIEIRNSKITDDGSWEYSLATKGLYVGGAIGALQNALNATANSPANTKIDHVAANVDISLNNPAFVDNGAAPQLGQFNVGGIIGRYCITNVAQANVIMPAYVFYSGDIKAPKAWISPVLAALRCKEYEATKSFANYSKQWEGNNNAAGTQVTIKNAHYYNFSIEGKKVTEFYPEKSCKWNARSITYHEDGTGNAETYNAKMYQGVNYGAIWVDAEGSSLKSLNENKVDNIYWTWKDGFVHMTETPCLDAYLTFEENDEETGVDITASVTEDGKGSSYRWQESFDGENWQDVDGETEKVYSSVYVKKPRVIVAYVTVDGIEYRTQALVVPAISTQYSPYLTSSGNDTDGYKYVVEWNGKSPSSLFKITYQWYKSDGKDQLVGQTNNTLYLSKNDVDAAGGVVWCKINLQYMGVDVDKYSVRSYPIDAIVVFVDGTKGIDNDEGSIERGWTPETAVKTIDHANSLLRTPEKGGTWDNNIIVIMGELTPNSFAFQSNGTNPATLTGKWNGINYAGVIKLEQINPLNASGKEDEHAVNPIHQPGKNGSNCYVLGDTRFEDLTFYGHQGGNTFIELHGRNVVFGKGLVMKNFKTLSESHGNFDPKNNIIPEFTILLTATNLCETDIQAYTNRTEPQVVTFESGHYGRIMAGRFTQNFFASSDNTAHSILGSAKHPVWAIVNVDIDNDNQQTDGENVTYNCDINAIIAGLTDGTMYGDYQINLHGGNVAYIVGGNQGNPVNNGDAVYKPIGSNLTEPGKFGQWPNSSYFGRTVINVEQDPSLKNIAVGGLYAGGLGRKIQSGNNATAIVDMYLYGRTVVNIKSGTVANVYGGGTGGVIGINPWDAHLPYATTADDNPVTAIQNGVQYGDTRQGDWSGMTTDSKLIAVKLHNLEEGTYQEEDLDLTESSTTVNIMGGTINGSVYGGGYGNVDGMPFEAAVQGVGSVFGTSNINITGGTINGSVYGGSQGHSIYLNKENKYGQTITHIAEMNGTVNINIKGDDDQYPTIGGNIYGGGQGLASNGAEEYLNIATTGNAGLGDKYKSTINITIDLPENVPFAGNIYGGGQLGMVQGNTNILIKRGTFTGNIFGGGKGEDNHPNKAKVIGTTNVKIGE